MIEIIEVQGITQLQDTGRFGYRRFGISTSGAMDITSLKAGNILLGNAVNTPSLELAMASLTIKFQQNCVFAVTGAFYQMELDSSPVYSFGRYNAKKGQILTLHRPLIGTYAYLSIAGGFDIEPVLGSCSTHERYSFGGYKGRYLKPGDRLPLKDSGITEMREISISSPKVHSRLRALPSTEYSAFTVDSQLHFWREKWRLQSNSDRMGYRFKGAQLTLKEPLEMQSHAVYSGVVQVPPGGQPIVLMADSQTTGGYPKIASVIEEDLGHLAQTRFGSSIQFELVDMDTAIKARKEREIYFYQIKRIYDANQ